MPLTGSAGSAPLADGWCRASAGVLFGVEWIEGGLAQNDELVEHDEMALGDEMAVGGELAVCGELVNWDPLEGVALASLRMPIGCGEEMDVCEEVDVWESPTLWGFGSVVDGDPELPDVLVVDAAADDLADVV